MFVCFENKGIGKIAESKKIESVAENKNKVFFILLL